MTTQSCTGPSGHARPANQLTRRQRKSDRLVNHVAELYLHPGLWWKFGPPQAAAGRPDIVSSAAWFASRRAEACRENKQEPRAINRSCQQLKISKAGTSVMCRHTLTPLCGMGIRRHDFAPKPTDMLTQSLTALTLRLQLRDH